MATGRTPRFGFTYPHGNDGLSNGDDVIQMLAEQVDALLWSWYSYMSVNYVFVMWTDVPYSMSNGVPVTTPYTSVATHAHSSTPAYNLASGDAGGGITIPVDGLYEVTVGCWALMTGMTAPIMQMNALFQEPGQPVASFSSSESTNIPSGNLHLAVQEVEHLSKDTRVWGSFTAFGGTSKLGSNYVRIAGPLGGVPPAVAAAAPAVARAGRVPRPPDMQQVFMGGGR